MFSHMKRTILLLLISTATLSAQTNPISTNAGPQIMAIDGYAAQVDSEIITYGDIREGVMPMMPRLMQQYQGQELADRLQQAYHDAREALIEEALLKAEVKELGVSLPESAIEEEVNRTISERFNNDRALLARALASRRMTYDEWKDDLAQQLTIRVFYSQEVLRRATVSEQAAKEAYEQNKDSYFIPFRVKYRFILLNKGTTAEEQDIKRKQAEEILQKLRNGADFVELAEEVSEGDIDLSPWRDPSDVRAELRSALQNTPAGEISNLIETDSLFYIVKVEERREEGYVPFEEVRANIEAALLAMERDRLHKDLIKRLSDKHFVERY